MTPDEIVMTIRNYWFNQGYDGVVVWWEKIQDYERHDHGSIPRHARFTIKSNIVNGYPPRDKEKNQSDDARMLLERGWPRDKQ